MIIILNITLNRSVRLFSRSISQNMNSIILFFKENYNWLFSGLGVVVLTGIVAILKKRRKDSVNINSSLSNSQVTNVYVSGQSSTVSSVSNNGIERLKSIVNILFIDDERFNMVNILKNAGWKNTFYKKDITNLQDSYIIKSHIIFVDVYGVGTTLFPKDQGLGLVIALKEKYPEKKIIVCSAEDKGDFLNKGIRKADECISKNAEPFEYINLVEMFAKELSL